MPQRAPSLALALLASLPALAHAAPPASEPEARDETCEAEPTLEDAMLRSGRELYLRGKQLYDAGDFLGAVEQWELMLALMPEQREQRRVQIAHAYREAYAVDADEGHLLNALELFNEQLDSLPVDDSGYADLEQEIAEIEAELEALAAARAKAEAEAEAALRQEQERIRARALAEAEAEHQRELQKTYYKTGGVATGLGASSFVAMVVLMSLGEQLDQEGDDLSQQQGIMPSEYSDLITRGVNYNRGAITAAVIGGALTVAGAALLGVGASRHPHLDDAGHEVALTPGGVQLRF